ncbi:MAG: TfoX/Sxy family protein [Alphaproteobacteria bacterium]|nr:TfoX/Sxy family protein [Alphaproteobacteria bacterium]
MAYDEGLAEILRNDLEGTGKVEERRMFGGLCFMLEGHMLCGVHKGGGMFRVGKDRQEAALAIDGASEMAFTGRKMGGLVDVTDEAMADDARRARWLALAMENVRSLPPR